MAAASCADANDAIASFEHDLGERDALHSYLPKPSEMTRQADLISERMYGFKTKSPRTPYICVWRDTGRPGAKDDDLPPKEVFLTCVFGASPWTPPPSLLEESAQRHRRDEAVLTIQWDRDGDSYRMSRFDVEIRDPEARVQFRSRNFGTDLAAIGIRRAEIDFPKSRSGRVKFEVSALVPQRQNQGQPLGKDKVTLTASGTAVPIPTWLNY